MPHMHPLLSATAAKPPKLSTSVSCPATTSDKSTICMPTVTKDVGLPATLYTKGSQAVQRHLKRARESFYKKKTTEKKAGYLTRIFGKAKKIVTVEDNTSFGVYSPTVIEQGTTESELAGNQEDDPSSTLGDLFLAEQNAPLVKVPASQSTSTVVPIDQRQGASVKPQEHMSTAQRDTLVVEETSEVTRDQGHSVELTSNRDNSGAAPADEFPVKTNAQATSETEATVSGPEPPCNADDSLAAGRATIPEPSRLPMPNSGKLRQRFSAPAIIGIGHFRSCSDSTLVESSPPSPIVPPPPPLSPVTDTDTRDEEAEAGQHSRAPSPSEQSAHDHVRQHQVSDALQGRVIDLINEIKAAQEMKWAKLLTGVVAETKAAKNEEWTGRLKKAVTQAEAANDDQWAYRLEKAVAQAEAAKDEELETFDRVKESSHNNAIQDLVEDHEQELQDLKEKHAEDIQELTKKHNEQLSELTRKHGLEARKLEMRRAQGAKEVTKLKEELSEMEAEKIATEKNLLHMTGQRDALSNAIVAMKSQFPPQAILSSERLQSDQDHNHRHETAQNTIETAGEHSKTITSARADAVNETPQPHQHGQQSQAPTVPHDPSPRLRLLEAENAQLRTDLEQRHADVKYAVEKADRLRALLEQDPAKSDSYPDSLIHQEVTADLRTRLADAHESLARERIETQRLRDRIDAVTDDVQNETLQRQLAVKDKEAAWEQNDALLRDLKGTFGKGDFDTAFWTHYEALARETAGLRGAIAGYEHAQRGMRQEAAELKARISELRLDLAISKDRGADDDDDDDDDDKGEDVAAARARESSRSQLLRLRVENDVLEAEVEFQVAENANRELGVRMPRGLKEVREGEVAAGLDGDRVRGTLEGRRVPGAEGTEGVQGVVIGTPESECSFF